MFCEDQEITCPWCFENIWIEVDPTESSSQVFQIDCEVCCRPLQIHSQRSADGSWSSSVVEG